MVRADLPPQRDDAPDERPAPARAATFEELYVEVAPALYAWAELRIRPEMRRNVDPQDVVQEVWLRAVKRHASFDPAASNFRAWILAIAKNVLLESFRKLRRTPLLEADLGRASRAFTLDGCPESITSFTQRLSKDDAVRRFLELAGSLEEDDRQILVRCGLEERTCADTARELELSEDAVIKRWQRLRTRLRGEAWTRAILAP